MIYKFTISPDGHAAFPYASPGSHDIWEVDPAEVRTDATPIIKLVHPEDLTQVEESIWQQIESGMNGYNDYVKYRLAVKDGTYKTVLDYGRIVESEHYGSVFYVLVVDCEFIKTLYDD